MLAANIKKTNVRRHISLTELHVSESLADKNVHLKPSFGVVFVQSASVRRSLPSQVI